MVVAARRDHGRHATVLGTIRIRVEALMQLRRSTQCKRPEKTYRNERCYSGASTVI
jgi:hypothetical protein